MDPSFEIPSDRQKPRSGWLCVLMALTALMLMMVSAKLGRVPG